jgi:hypothetical protein
MTGDAIEKRKDRYQIGIVVTVITVLVAVITLLFGDSLIARASGWLKRRQPPTFEISALNTLASNQYEIGYLLVNDGKETDGLKFDWELQIIPTYRGDSLGKVDAIVRREDGEEIGSDSWREFTANPPTLIVQLDPLKVMSALDPLPGHYFEQDGRYIFPEEELTLEIRRAGTGKLLDSATFTLLNTPWYHYTKISHPLLWEGQETTDIFTHVRNLGGAGEFVSVVEIFEITTLAGEPYSPWPKIGWITADIKEPAGQGEEIESHFRLPDDSQAYFEFEPGKCYAVRTYATKKQNYIRDEQGRPIDWHSHAWRFADPPDELRVCYVTE